MAVSDRTNPSARPSERIGLPQENWPITIDGVRYCRRCYEDGHRTPTHDQATRSPYCEFHFKEARSSAKRRWRDRAKASEGAIQRATKAPQKVYSDADGHLVLDPDGAERLRADLARWRENMEEVAETLGFAVGSGAGNAMVQRAVADLTTIASQVAEWSARMAEDDPA